jgi:hypothetical protein
LSGGGTEAARSERAMGFLMSIRDPGDQYLYLVVETNGEQLLVLKRNRAIRFDAFWITEPASEEDKPDLTLTLFEVPEELWDVMTEEERLTVHNAGLRREIRQLKKQRSNLIGWLVMVSMIGWCFVVLFFAKLSN